MLKVTRTYTAERWVIDTTGCQYGFADVLMPYEKYIVQRGCQIRGEPSTYVATETKDLDYFATLPFMNKTRHQRERKEQEREARLHFAVFVDTCVDEAILQGSTTAFNNSFESFVGTLRRHMLDFASRSF